MIAPSGLPSYLQQNTAATSQGYLAQLPGMFNTSNLQSAYGNQEQANWDSGSALAAAAANQYVQRANQSGASTLGAGFAQASAMLPVYQQNAAMQSDLANKQLQYKAQQATIGAGLSGDIGRLQSQQQSTWSDYLLNQQKLQQQNQQFNLNLGLQRQQLGDTFSNQQAQTRMQGSALALQYAPRDMSGTYYTNAQGQPASSADAATQARIRSAQGYEQNAFSNLAPSTGYGGTGGYGSYGQSPAVSQWGI